MEELILEFRTYRIHLDDCFVIIKNEIPKYFLKIFIVIQEKFLLSDNQKNKSMFPIYFINKVFNMFIDFPELRKAAHKYELLQFLCKNCIFREEFSFKTFYSVDRNYQFGRNQRGKEEIYLPYLDIIQKIFRKYPESNKILFELTDAVKNFYLNLLIAGESLSNNSGLNFNFIQIFPILYMITGFFTFGNLEKYLEIDFKIFELFTQHLFTLQEIGQTGDTLFPDILEFLETAALVEENIDVFLAGGPYFRAMLRYLKEETQQSIENIIINLSKRKRWNNLSCRTQFFMWMKEIYEEQNGLPNSLKNKLLIDFLKLN